MYGGRRQLKRRTRELLQNDKEDTEPAMQMLYIPREPDDREGARHSHTSTTIRSPRARPLTVITSYK